MALELRKSFVSAQYLENKSSEFQQILYVHSYWQDLAWDCYTSFFLIFIPELWHLDLGQSFISAQYLENKLREFHQILLCIHIDKI